VARSNELSGEGDPLTNELAKWSARTAVGRRTKSEIAAAGVMGGAVWGNLARSALQDYQNANQGSEGSP
jgi:hypothetical protein